MARRSLSMTTAVRWMCRVRVIGSTSKSRLASLSHFSNGPRCSRMILGAQPWPGKWRARARSARSAPPGAPVGDTKTAVFMGRSRATQLRGAWRRGALAEKENQTLGCLRIEAVDDLPKNPPVLRLEALRAFERQTSPLRQAGKKTLEDRGDVRGVSPLVHASELAFEQEARTGVEPVHARRRDHP